MGNNQFIHEISPLLRIIQLTYIVSFLPTKMCKCIKLAHEKITPFYNQNKI